MHAEDVIQTLPLMETEPSIRRVDSADYVYIMFGTTYRLGFRRGDLASRNVVIATLLEAGFKGRVVARLVGVSPALVSSVKNAVKRGGLRAATEVGKPGRKRLLVGERREQAIELRARGASHQEIATRLGVSRPTVAAVLQDMPRGEPKRREELNAEVANEAYQPESEQVDEDTPQGEQEELAPCSPLPPSNVEHPTPYAGTVLLCAVLQVLGVPEALMKAGAKRTVRWGYRAVEIVYALVCGWAAGYRSLESMHERDAGGLGVILGLERSPSVRTLHRAIRQMTETLQPLVLGAALLRGVARTVEASLVISIDGHFKRYSGKEPIDKGWDAKGRIAAKGLQDVYVTDLQGFVLSRVSVGAGDRLSSHVIEVARTLRAQGSDGERIVIAFDRGGFTFDVLDTLDSEGFGYITYVPATVKTPDIEALAPVDGDLAAIEWSHGSLSHPARLLALCANVR